MFDTYIARPAPAYAQSVRVEHIEHRAPTDESVALLREIQKEAEKDRIEAFTIQGNGFSGRVEIFRDMATQDLRGLFAFDLNGSRHTFRESVYAGEEDAKAILIAKLRDGAAKLIASTILIPALIAEGGMIG